MSLRVAPFLALVCGLVTGCVSLQQEPRITPSELPESVRPDATAVSKAADWPSMKPSQFLSRSMDIVVKVTNGSSEGALP